MTHITLSWVRDPRSEAENFFKELGKHHCAMICFFTVKQWEKGLRKFSVYHDLVSVREGLENLSAASPSLEIVFNVYTKFLKLIY